MLMSFAVLGQTRYVWKASGNSWADANSWSPARTVPKDDDILVFGEGLPARAVIIVDVDFGVGGTFSNPPQTVGQLIFTNNVQTSLRTVNDRMLNIRTALQLGNGALLKIVGTSGNLSSLTMSLMAGAQATIAGRLEFTSSTGSASKHTLIASTPGAIEFLGGSYFKAGPQFSGNPFGTGTTKASDGTVLLDEGATYEQADGGTPFGSGAYEVLLCKPGSTFLFTATGSPSLSGHMFGHLILNTGATSPAYATGKLIIQNDLTVTAGNHIINAKDCDLRGNISITSGSLRFNPSSNLLALTFNGATAQTIGGALTLGTNVTLVLNNAAGLTLQRPLQVNGALTLTQGLLTTTAASGLTLGAGATISPGSAASFINGPLSRVQTGTAVNLAFPIGSGKVYRPLALTGQQTDANPTTYTAQQFEQAPPARALPTAVGSLQRVSNVRYFNLTNNGATNFGQGAVTLNYDTDDRVDAPAKLRLAKSDNAGNWLDLGGVGTGAPAGSITSTVPFASFSDFVLASTEATGGAGNNPLPVVLTGFSAQRQAAGVRLSWATASELNNSRFEVQRSADGRAFATLKTVPGSGSSAAPHAYSWLDAAGPAGGPLYYRLRQVDADGTGTYSPVATVLPDAAQPGVFPNPAQQHIRFGAPAGSAYRVLNVLGQPVLAGRTPAEGTALSVADVGSGVYYLEISSAQGRVRHRFVKE